MMGMDEPAQRPEGALIDALLKARSPKLSATAAAKHAGITEGYWRQIIKGYQSKGNLQIPVKAPDDTLARMARAVGATPTQLREMGRDGAADELEALLKKSEEFQAVRQKLGDIYDTMQQQKERPPIARIKLPDATPVDLLILARDTPPEDRTEQQWQLIYEAEERVARLERSMAAVTEELLHQRQTERGATDAAPTDQTAQSDASSEAGKAQEVSARPAVVDHSEVRPRVTPDWRGNDPRKPAAVRDDEQRGQGNKLG